MSDQSIEELQVKVAFLEDSLAKLSDEFVLQKRELDELKSVHHGLLDKVRAMSNSQNEGGDILDERPPHY